jgi:hypothetical protein
VTRATAPDSPMPFLVGLRFDELDR